MAKILLSLTLIFALEVYGQNEVSSDLQTTLQKFQSINESVDGDSCSDEKLDRRISKTQVKGPKGKSFEISVVSEEYLNELFTYLAKQKHIPFRYPEDVCYAKAHEMARLLEEKGIITGKTFIEGHLRLETKNATKGFVEWSFHVAPVVGVRNKAGKVNLYVIDPAIFGKAVPLKEWQDIQTRHNQSGEYKKYLMPRFSYKPDQLNEKHEGFSAKELTEVKSALEEYLTIQSRKEAEEALPKIERGIYRKEETVRKEEFAF